MMPGMTRSERAVATLHDVDPEFVDFVETLYGPGVDAEEVWADVFAKADTTTDAAARRKKIVSGVGAGIGAASSAIGVGEGVRAVREFRGGSKGKAALSTGKAGVLLAGDVLGTLALKDNATKKPVSKANPPLGKLVQGRLTVNRLMAKMPSATAVAQGAGKAAATPIATAGRAAQSKPGVGVLAGAGGVLAGRASKPAQPQVQATIMPQTQPPKTMQKGQPNVGKAHTVEWEGTFSKLDDEKMQAFGFASVVKKDGRPVIDRQGDFVTPEDMEIAAYTYVQKSRRGGDMHRRTLDDQVHHVSDLIESMVFTPEKCAAMGLTDEVAKSLEGHWWVGYQIHDPATWDEVKKGNRTGFSIHGRGKRTLHEDAA